MRSYRVSESVSDRARGVVRIERLEYPATMSSAPLASQELAVALGDILSSEHVHVYRQLMRPDGTTRVFLIDVDGLGLEVVEGAVPSSASAPVRTADGGLVAPATDPLARASSRVGKASRRPPQPGRGHRPGPRRAP